eukprot:3189472-Rhodomonas_salina.4
MYLIIVVGDTVVFERCWGFLAANTSCQPPTATQASNQNTVYKTATLLGFICSRSRPWACGSGTTGLDVCHARPTNRGLRRSSVVVARMIAPTTQ